MLASPVEQLPLPRSCVGGCVYEAKFDGFRLCALRTDEGKVQLRSRTARRLDSYFPDLRRWIAMLPPATALDGEVVAWSGAGRTDFGALQSRLVAGRSLPQVSARAPAYLIAFDALIVDGRDLRDRPLTERRDALEALLANAPDRLLVCPQTADRDEALAMVAEMANLGVEGLVVKPAAGRYRGGRHRGGWLKYRIRHTTECVVGGITGSRSQPETLILGQFDTDHRLRVVGRTTRINIAQATQIAPLLHPPGRGHQHAAHPWPQPLPAGWLGHIGQPEALPYRPVEPELVVEVSVDRSVEHGRFRHPVRLVRLRADLSPWDTPPFRSDEP